MIVTCEQGEMRASADGLFVYDAMASAKSRCRKSVRCPGRSEVLDDMIAAIRDRPKPPLHDGRWAKANVEVTLAILQSARERREIMLEHQVACS